MRLEKHGYWSEAHAESSDENIRVCLGVNQWVEIDKLYGPLAASFVRIRLEYLGDVTDWVVECQNPSTGEWEEKARWDCQENWPEDL